MPGWIVVVAREARIMDWVVWGDILLGGGAVVLGDEDTCCSFDGELNAFECGVSDTPRHLFLGYRCIDLIWGLIDF